MAGNCELRSIVLCSHGNKDGKIVEKMRARPQVAPSTIRVPSSTNLFELGNVAEASEEFYPIKGDN